MNKAIKDFMGANAIQKKLLVRAGFELETQRTGDSEEIDYDAASEAIHELVSDQMINIPRHVRDAMNERSEDQIRDALYERYSEDFDYSDYTIKLDHDDIERKIGNSDIEVGDDASVSGVEIRTIGGLKYLDFVQAARDAFSIDHEIDTRCSFHIHLSIPGVEHVYGDRFQLALVEYLIENMARLPNTVQDRFHGAPSNQYIKGMISSKNKYSFVHKHSQGTWEFRCFGNVQNENQAIICLNLAIEAMAHAYEVTRNGKKLFTDGYDGDIEALLHECLRTYKPISRVLRARKVA